MIVPGGIFRVRHQDGLPNCLEYLEYFDKISLQRDKQDHLIYKII